ETTIKHKPNTIKTPLLFLHDASGVYPLVLTHNYLHQSVGHGVVIFIKKISSHGVLCEDDAVWVKKVGIVLKCMLVISGTLTVLVVLIIITLLAYALYISIPLIYTLSYPFNYIALMTLILVVLVVVLILVLKFIRPWFNY
ncbi:hypothetical protein, partial [Caldivirga sp.]|uniref:hypothetical protein n=1 Tax=Caldivirga sp. TaxID=2080243 RepID=UPI0025BB599E